MIECLAIAIYFEAQGEPDMGQIAVGQTVINRTYDRRWPDNICDVVYQGPRDSHGNMVKHKCQFSFYCDGLPDRPSPGAAWEAARHNALMAETLHRVGVDVTDGATHYHADYVAPGWADRLTRLFKIGRHIFYR